MNQNPRPTIQPNASTHKRVISLEKFYETNTADRNVVVQDVVERVSGRPIAESVNYIRDIKIRWIKIWQFDNTLPLIANFGTNLTTDTGLESKALIDYGSPTTYPSLGVRVPLTRQNWIDTGIESNLAQNLVTVYFHANTRYLIQCGLSWRGC